VADQGQAVYKKPVSMLLPISWPGLFTAYTFFAGFLAVSPQVT